ncbi:FeoB-associated Cys-rich membrane protein [Roseivirga spongicola]|uniref:FeoB-associated Cys-rich membrane protein n=1 Tax=Roseivirga spongicola TaxID=333140 RepID=UPI000A02A48B|nr:FeoB-associated Cys-rich membrane protein [Roseivirga spongicola]MBO6496886.1 FeoB-associated Cys-rich membrane protein [Roseivirga sp.]MBO6661463.1 FeoB-associated Cys-rich membrane protein [Roseivirga sp.]MBO6759960.1 FeoB-associated Cys-rich membrane protein [Roseivirga sp.]MBO6908553.1 FeoB-associated Cys-rich membrane protein [Roseivirga sp.]WPZ11454.1 FeoB-associated Cys-rich membrane protein [Roseivirga spongicola]
MQEVIIGILFLAALFFMGRKLYRQYKAKDSSCASGCDKCSPAPSAKPFKMPDHLKG